MKIKRVVGYMGDKDYRTLQTILDLEGATFSQWLRRAAAAKIVRARAKEGRR